MLSLSYHFYINHQKTNIQCHLCSNKYIYYLWIQFIQRIHQLLIDQIKSANYKIQSNQIQWQTIVSMFTNNIFNINSSNRVSDCNRNEQNTYQRKAQQFHKHIRKNNIEDKKQRIRQQMLLSFCEDYTLLKQINLNKSLAFFSELNCEQFSNDDEQLKNIIEEMYVYCTSKQSDHMYYLFSQSILMKLTKLITIEKIINFENNSRLFIKILWILANYTIYSNYSSELFRDTMFQILKQILHISNFYSTKSEFKIFTHVQTKQIMNIILLSLCNITNLQEETERYFEQKEEDNLYFLLIEQGRKIKASCLQLQIKDTFIETILKKIYKIFENLFGLEDRNQQIMKNIYRTQNQVIEIVFSHLQIFKISSIDMETEIIMFLRTVLLNDIQRYPQMVLNHNFTMIYPIFSSVARETMETNYKLFNYHNLVQIEGEQTPSFSLLSKRSKFLQHRIINYLELFNILFGLNIPQDKNELLYYDLYNDWLQNYLLPIFYQICKIKDNSFDLIKQKIIKILHDVCLQEEFCQSIISDLTIMSNIFRFAKTIDSNIRLRKSSLDCLASIIRVALDGQSTIKDTVLEICSTNSMISILAQSIGQYVDEQLNENLLTALQIYLRSNITEQSDSNRLWIQFCSEGGLIRLNNYLECCQSSSINEIAESIIKQYDRQ